MRKHKARNIILLAVGVFIVLLVVAFFLREIIANYFVKANMQSIAAPSKGSRLLVFSPHNDDEVLGAAELIKKTIKNGGKVEVVFITNGDGYKNAIEFDYLDLHPKPTDYVKFGYTRQKESIKALKLLGLPRENIIFLGYPDGGISYLWSTNWDNNEPYTSRYTQKNRSVYDNSFTKDALYTGENISADIRKIIEDFKPTHIAYPHPNDRHPDHWATNAFVKYVLTSIKYAPDYEWLYLVHRGDWPTPLKRDTNLYLVPPAKLVNVGTTWEALDLSSSDINQKARAIHSYKSQLRTLGPLLTAFERKNELFGVYGNAKLRVYERTDSEIAADDSNEVVIDPLRDALRLEISRGADISGIYAEISKQNNLHIFMMVDGEIERLTRYNFNMIFINNNNVFKRLNLAVLDKKLNIIKTSNESITKHDGINMDFKGNTLHVVIPIGVTGDFTHVFVNTNTSSEDHMIDKTSWRMLDK